MEPNVLIRIAIFLMKRKKKGDKKQLKIPLKSGEGEKLSSQDQDLNLNPIDESTKEVVLAGDSDKEPEALAKTSAPQAESEKTAQSVVVETSEAKQIFSNSLEKSRISEDSNWFIVSASTVGKSHRDSQIPCQDSHHLESINDKWGIAISCDGAGSAKNSHLGSKYVATEAAPAFFRELVIKSRWHENDFLPTQEEWSLGARTCCVSIRHSLQKFGDSQKMEFDSLACTIIVVIYCPMGLLVTHIGDGRAGYCNKDGEWKSLMSPHKGEEANQTVFVTSKNWVDESASLMSGVGIPESRVILEKPKAFTLMSDGCELHSFECSVMDENTNKWHDPNLPYPKFFDPLVENLKLMHQNKTSNEAANEKWLRFIENGNKGMSDEPDDKTMILGILI